MVHATAFLATGELATRNAQGVTTILALATVCAKAMEPASATKALRELLATALAQVGATTLAVVGVPAYNPQSVASAGPTPHTDTTQESAAPSAVPSLAAATAPSVAAPPIASDRLHRLSTSPLRQPPAALQQQRLARSSVSASQLSVIRVAGANAQGTPALEAFAPATEPATTAALDLALAPAMPTTTRPCVPSTARMLTACPLMDS